MHVTNYERFRIKAAAHERHSQECLRINHCRHCRLSEEFHAYSTQSWAVGGMDIECQVRFGHAPYGMPIDIRIPWEPEPEKDPNPL